MEARFPDLGEAITALRVGMPLHLDARTIRPGPGVPPGTVGTAIDYRIRYHLAVTPNEDFIAAHGAEILLERHLNEFDPENAALWRNPLVADGFRVSGVPSVHDPEVAHLAPAAFFQYLVGLVADIQPVGRALDAASEERLDRACAVLALYEEVFRTGRVWPTSPLASLPIESSVDAVLALIPRSWTEDIANVCTRLLAEVPLRGDAILNPKFASGPGVGGADADLVLGGCLLDIKSTVNPRLDLMWLLQLLGYTLLDSDDAYHIDAVGILLARQAAVTRWPLAALLDATAGPTRPALGEMRAEFADFLSTLSRPRPMVVIYGPGTAEADAPGNRVPTPPIHVTPHPSTLETLSLDEAAELTGRARSTIRRAIAKGRLVASPPAAAHPAGYGSGFRLPRVAVEALFPPTPEARAALHECGQECVQRLHVSYLAAQVANRNSAEEFLRQTFHIGELVVQACQLATVATDGLPLMMPFYVRGVFVPPDYPWRSWRVAWHCQ
jgi:hypothetical protein